MSEDAKKYRAEMRTKAYRIANQSDEPVDASDWRRTADDLTAKKKVTIKQGPFEKCGSGPSNPREYANGGLVARKNGGRMPRKGRAMGGQNMPVAPMPTGAALGNQVVPQAILNPRGVTQGSKLVGMSSGGGINIKPSHKGMLHKELGVPEGKKIPEKSLKKAATSSDPAERKRAVFAENAKHWSHKANGGSAMPKVTGGSIDRAVENQANLDRQKLATLHQENPAAKKAFYTPKAKGGGVNSTELYNYGHADGATFKERGLPKPSWFNGRLIGAGNQVSKDYGEGFRAGVTGMPKQRAKGGEVVGNTDVTGTRPTGGRLARAGGGKAGKGKTNINIIIAQKPDGMMGQGMPPGAPPPPRPSMAPPPGTMPGAPGMGGPGGPMPPPGGNPMPGGMPARPMPGGPNMPPPSMMRKAGGRIPGYPLDAGSGGGKGRLEKAKAYGP